MPTVEHRHEEKRQNQSRNQDSQKTALQSVLDVIGHPAPLWMRFEDVTVSPDRERRCQRGVHKERGVFDPFPLTDPMNRNAELRSANPKNAAGDGGVVAHDLMHAE